MWWKGKIKYKTAFSVQSDLDIRRLRELMKTVAGKELKKKEESVTRATSIQQMTALSDHYKILVFASFIILYVPSLDDHLNFSRVFSVYRLIVIQP